ncbi:MAG: GNAT family N-acetyltransferase [Prevotella sp.]|uniref:GNAT family N-acetyltransferase n=1 Tax=Prevotella sp. AGR2160 TaxID=1280674 RepID=UPI0004204B07|nr:GNAT family N-acetyltransferase [Prevotella sp. AGR2160]MDD5861746.1 GNAT family N-acetyltransferase [Prevotella sp.]
MIIRRIEKVDNQRIAALIRAPFDEYDMEKQHTVYDDETTDHQYEVFKNCASSVLWVAEDQGKVIGSCGVYSTEGLPEGWCEIVKFYVDQNERGKGTGSILFEKALQSAVSLGYHTAYLETFPEFAGAVKLYERLGFKRIDHQVGSSGHTATSIWMTKTLRTESFDDQAMRRKVLGSVGDAHER